MIQPILTKIWKTINIKKNPLEFQDTNYLKASESLILNLYIQENIFKGPS